MHVPRKLRLVTPADGTVGEDVEEGGAVCGDRALDLHAQVVPVRRGRLRHVGHVVRDCDGRHVLAPLRLAEALEAGGARGRARAERRRPRALDARVHVGLVVVADEEEAMAALERARERLKADVVGSAVACEDDDGHVLVRRERVPATQRTLRALDAACHRSRVLERDVEPRNVPRGRGKARRRDLETAGGVHHDDRLGGSCSGPCGRPSECRSPGRASARRAAAARRAGSARSSSDATSLASQSDVGICVAGEDRTHVRRVQVAAAEAVDVAG